MSFCRFATFCWFTGRGLFLIFPFDFLTVRFLMSDSVGLSGSVIYSLKQRALRMPY